MKIFNFSEFLIDNIKIPLHVVDANYKNKDFVSIDLSVKNKALDLFDISVSNNLDSFINDFIQERKAKVAFGGYLEKRSLYKRSTYFKNESKENERNIHLGVDLWCNAFTPVFAPLDATVHSFNNNTNFGDYGPTIILKHSINNVEFYTLYGHLSTDSISNLYVGKTIKKDEKIGVLGTADVNGDYPPHLHFQIIKDMQGFVGDYPGVCSKTDLAFYKINCPDPNILLKL